MMRRISPIAAFQGSTTLLRHISSLDPYTQEKKMASSHMTKLLLNSNNNNNSLGLQFNLFPLSSTVFAEYSGMQHHLKQTITTLENIISTSEEESMKVDYIVFRFNESIADENIWTRERMKLSLSFLRELGTHILPSIPLVLSIPVTVTNKMTLSYVEDIFETLHRVGWTNILLELPPLNNRSLVKETYPFYRSRGILKNWQLLLQPDVDKSVLSSQYKPISLTTLFPWILQEGFLNRFSVGLSVDVRSSLQSLTLLQEEEINGDVEKLSEDSIGEKKECHNNNHNNNNEKEEDKLNAWMKERMQRNNSQRLPKDKYSHITKIVKESPKELKESGMITLDTPPKEFTDMLLAQQQSFQMKDKGMEEETIMLAQFLQQTFNSDAKNKNTEIQKDEKKESQISAFLTNQSDMKLNKEQQQQQRSGLIYWKLLGEIAQRTQAQYLCTAPCINPISLNTWKQAWMTTCMMCNRNEIRDEPFLSNLGLLPVVDALWPLLSPTQLERERRLASSNEIIQGNENLRDALLFVPLYVKQELESAIVKIPPSILQHAFNSVVVQKKEKRRETQIIHDGGSLRLCCSSRRLNNGGDTSEDVLRILGAGDLGRKSLLSKLPVEQKTCLREVEMMFRDNCMKRVFGEMIQSTRVKNNDSYSSHLLLAVPPDTEPSVLLESLRFLRSTSS